MIDRTPVWNPVCCDKRSIFTSVNFIKKDEEGVRLDLINETKIQSQTFETSLYAVSLYLSLTFPMYLCERRYKQKEKSLIFPWFLYETNRTKW